MLSKGGLGVVACVICISSGAWAQSAPPAAPVRPVVETRYGETLSDPYRWMEGMGPEFMAWLRTQDGATRAYFNAMPGYKDFVAAEKAAYASEVSLSSLQRVGDMLYYERQGDV